MSDDPNKTLPVDPPKPLDHHQLANQRIVVYVCLAVVVATMGTVIFMVVRPGQRTPFEYIIVTALLCFSLSCISGLLFAATHVEIKGTLGFVTVALAGPAAAWLVALLIFAKIVFPAFEKQLNMLPENFESLVKLVSDVEAHEEKWETFDTWKSDIRPLDKLFDGDEETNLRVILSGAFIKGGSRSNLKDPQLQTLFVYPTDEPGTDCPQAVIKLQRISGLPSTPGKRRNIFVVATATLTEGTPQAFLFTKGSSGKINMQPPSLKPVWLEVDSEQEDVLLLARYCNDRDKAGDWIQVQTPKYLETGPADVKLAIASDYPIDRPSVGFWEMKGAEVHKSGDTPLLFRKINKSPVMNIDGMRAPMVEWLKNVESFVSKTPNQNKDTLKVLEWTLSKLRGKKPGSAFLPDDAYPSRLSYETDNVENTVHLTFLWAAN